MRFFNIREQVVSLVMPDGKSAVTFNFKQNPADAMLQELIITDARGGPTAVLTFDKAGGMREARWEGKDGVTPGDPDAAQLDQQQAEELGLKPGQKTVDSGGRLIQVPGAKRGGAAGGRGAPVRGGSPADTSVPGEGAAALDQPFTEPAHLTENTGADDGTPANPASAPAQAGFETPTPPVAALNTTESMKARPPRNG